LVAATETTEVLVSAEASGRLLYFDIEEGMLLKAGEEVGVVEFRSRWAADICSLVAATCFRISGRCSSTDLMLASSCSCPETGCNRNV